MDKKGNSVCANPPVVSALCDAMGVVMRHRTYHGFLSLLLLLTACSGEPPIPRPNILYIMTDDHAAHMLSVYGSNIAATPNLDRIATGVFASRMPFAPIRSVHPAGRLS